MLGKAEVLQIAVAKAVQGELATADDLQQVPVIGGRRAAVHEPAGHDEYLRLAPDPDHFPTFFAKKTEMDRNAKDVPDEAIRAITAPTLLIIGDSDIVRPEHMVEFFRLLGGGVIGDLAGLPRHQLAILPGTTHVTVVDQVDLVVPMIKAFLGAPMPEAK